MDTTLSTLLSGNLPASVNRYTLVADALAQTLQPATSNPPTWLYWTLIAFCVCHFLQTCVCIAVVVVVTLEMSSFWIFRTGHNGVWDPNTRVVFSCCSGVFSCLILFDSAWTVLASRGIVGLGSKTIITGVRWVPLLLAGWFFAHGVVTHILSAQSDSGILSVASKNSFEAKIARGMDSRGWSRACNSALIIVPIIVTATLSGAFVAASIAIDKSTSITLGVVKSLYAVAPAYDPNTFNLTTDLMPLLRPLEKTAAPLARFKVCYKLGWSLLALWAVLLLLLIGPLTVRHVGLLQRLMGAKSVYSALFFPHRVTRRCPGMVQLVPSASSGGFTVVEVKDPVEQKNRSLQADCWSLALTATCIMLLVLVYTPLALWAAIPDSLPLLHDKTFFAIQTIWGSGLYAVIGLTISATFFYRTLINLQFKRSPGTKRYLQSDRSSDFIRRSTTVSLDEYRESTKEAQLGFQYRPTPIGKPPPALVAPVAGPFSFERSVGSR